MEKIIRLTSQPKSAPAKIKPVKMPTTIPSQPPIKKLPNKESKQRKQVARAILFTMFLFSLKEKIRNAINIVISAIIAKSNKSIDTHAPFSNA